MPGKRGKLMVGLVAAFAVILTAAVRISLSEPERRGKEPDKGLGEMLAEANQGTFQEGGKTEEGAITLKWAFAGGMPPEPYEEALNEALKKKGLPWRVAFTELDELMTNGLANPLSYKRQLEQENYDIVSCCDYGHFFLYGILAREGLLEPLDLRMEETEEGGRLKAAYPEVVWDAVQVDGAVYGIPSLSAFVNGSGYYLAINEEIAEKYQLDFEKLTPESLDAMLRTVTEKERAAGNVNFYGGYFPVWNGNSQKTLLPFLQICPGDGKPKVENLLENEEYLENRKRRLDLLCEGYLFREEDEGLIKRGDFLMLAIYSYCEEAALQKAYGRWEIPESLRLKVLEFSGQDDVFYGGGGKTGIWAAGGRKEEAFSLLAAVFSDAELSNAMAYGTRGKDYQVKDGKATRDIVPAWEDYAGNLLLVLPGKSDPADRAERLHAILEEKKPGAILRYEFDPQQVLEEWLKLWELYEENWSELCHCEKEERKKLAESGQPETCACNQNWEEELEKFKKAVKEAGIDQVMEYMEGLIRQE